MPVNLSLSYFVKAVGATAAGVTGFLVYYLPNTVFIHKFQDITQLYRHADSVPVSSEIESLCKEAMKDLEFPPDAQEKVHLYTGAVFDFVYAGSVWKYKAINDFEKAIIGVPVSFGAHSFDATTKEDMVLQGKSIDWKSKWGEKLEKSLLLSDKAKKFALAQHLYYITNCEPIVKGGLTAFLLWFSLIVTENMQRNKNIQRRSRFLRYGLYLGVCFSNVMLWALSKDLYRCSLEKKADDTVAALGKDYIEGGFEFYESILSRNVALNGILQDRGGKLQYTKFGNEHSLIRQRHLPLTVRRDFFQKLQEEAK